MKRSDEMTIIAVAVACTTAVSLLLRYLSVPVEWWMAGLATLALGGMLTLLVFLVWMLLPRKQANT